MQIFISEYLTSGAWTGQVSESLTIEGRAMLLAFAADAARIPDVDVVTTWDSRLGPFPSDGIDARIVGSREEETALFRQLSRSADAVLAIAPETENLLLDRFDGTRQADGRWVGASRSVIQVTTDKLKSFRRLYQRGVATIPTVSLSEASTLSEGSIVIKPRDGAGADETFVVDVAGDVAGDVADLPLSRRRDHYIAQPLIDGESVSCFCVISGQQFQVFPMVRQRIVRSFDNNGAVECLRYLGGEMPLTGDYRQLIQNGLSALGATAGHFGIDILIPRDGTPPMIVEVNPRLTTSYIGYRQILDHNVAERILFPDRFNTTIESNGCRVEFDTSGTTKILRSIEEHS